MGPKGWSPRSKCWLALLQAPCSSRVRGCAQWRGPRRGWGEPRRRLGSPLPSHPFCARRPEPEQRPSPAPAPGHLGTWLGSGFLTQSSPPSRALPTLGGALPTGRPLPGCWLPPHLGIVRWQDHWGGPGWGWLTAAQLGLGCSSTIPTEGAWPGTQGKAPLAPLASAPAALPHPREGLSRPGLPTRTFVCRSAPALRSTGQRKAGLHASHQKKDPLLSSHRPCLGGDPGGPEPRHHPQPAVEGGRLSAYVRGVQSSVFPFHLGAGWGAYPAASPPPRAARSPGVELHPES